ncbi:flotillin-like FloA family protein [Maribellus sediminis]|uniref:flotillin-like FloA family protein n=1 Tax=Maribellus sediminis TaxID=2696285 RepID=UPI0014300167|nr:flotillin-like FloA family protein [Maribellus sediminis]
MENLNPLIIIIPILVLFFIILFFLPIGLWFAATVSGVRISLMELLLMRIRRSPIQEIVSGLIVSAKGGLNLSREELEAFALSGGNIQNVVNGMVAAKQAGFPLSFNNAAKADAQGLDIVASVKEKMRETQKVQFE